MSEWRERKKSRPRRAGRAAAPARRLALPPTTPATAGNDESFSALPALMTIDGRLYETGNATVLSNVYAESTIVAP
jgi:hypothetical protein